MITWVLIYWIITATNAVTNSVVFETKDLCEAALGQIQDDWGAADTNGVKYGVVGGVCASQGTTGDAARPLGPSQPQGPVGKPE